MPRRASYVASPEASYYVTTILWENDLTGRSWYESGIRDLEDPDQRNAFTLVQHDIGPLERGHAKVVELLKLGVDPDRVAAAIERPSSIMGLLRMLKEEVE